MVQKLFEAKKWLTQYAGSRYTTKSYN